jgi:hypothetical protein
VFLGGKVDHGRFVSIFHNQDTNRSLSYRIYPIAL